MGVIWIVCAVSLAIGDSDGEKFAARISQLVVAQLCIVLV